MKFKELKKAVKESQKTLANQITRGKFLRKPSNRNIVTKEDKDLFYLTYSGNEYFSRDRIDRKSFEYRHTHIAYCIFFNKTPYEKIESTTRKDNKPIQSIILSKITEWEKLLDEDVRDCA